MRTRRTTPSIDLVPPARDPFESSTLYELVSRLAVRSYEDLLAPHWTIPDRPSPAACLERDRFTRRRSRSGARAVLALHAERSLGTRGAVAGGGGNAAALAARRHLDGAEGARGAAASDPRSRTAAEWLRQGLAACLLWLQRFARFFR